MLSSIKEALEVCGAHDGMTVSFHHHLRGGDGVLVNVMNIIRDMGFKDINLAPSSLHDGQKELIGMFKDGTVTQIQTGANGPLGLSVTAGDLQKPMVVRSHGARVRAIKEGDIKIDIAFIAAPEADDQGNCNGVHGRNACGPLAYSAIDAKLAKHVVVVTDNLVEYPCTPAPISENYVDYIVKVDSIGDANKIVGGTTRISSDPQTILIGETCAALMDALGLLNSSLVFQAGSGGTSLTAMKGLSDRLERKGISARMANGGTTCILVDMLKKGLVRKLTTCQSFDLTSVKSMVEDYPFHVETDIDQYANPSNSGSVVNNLDVMVAGGTEVDIHFNCNVNTHSDGTFQHNTGGHQDTAAGAKLTIITMPVSRRCNPGIVDNVTSITTPGECIGAIVTEVGVAINPRRTDLLELLKGKTEEELGFKLMTIEAMRDLGIAKAGRPHSLPVHQEKIIGVIEWRDGTVLDVVHQPIDRKGMGINNAVVKIEENSEDKEKNIVIVTVIDKTPYVSAEEVKEIGLRCLEALGVKGCKMTVVYDYAKDYIIASAMECQLRRKYNIPLSKAFHLFERKAYPEPDRNRPQRRSHLYIPGNDAYMVAKAEGSVADGVILDLEDAVDPTVKDYARNIIRHSLRGAIDFGNVEKMIRINGVDELGFTDLQAILPFAPVDVLVVPKVEFPEEIITLEKKICEILHVEKNPVLLLCLIESAVGVENAFQIVNASKNIIGVSMGLEDYTADRGIVRTPSDEESQWAMQRVCNAATTASIQMVDVVYSTLDDDEGLRKAIIRAKKMGCFGKRCIHPNQVPVCNEGFNPEKDDIFEATNAIAAYVSAGPGVGVVKFINRKGKAKMVDRPVLIRAVKTVKLCLAVSLLPEDPWRKHVETVLSRINA
jgi:citrate lyase subunit alpha/citrate CoA-transferase